MKSHDSQEGKPTADNADHAVNRVDATAVSAPHKVLENSGNANDGVGDVREVTERNERKRQLERQRDELDTLNRINGLLLDIMRELFELSSLEQIKQIVCEHLVDSEFYQVAWIGEPETGGTKVIPQASAGIEDDYIETVTIDETATEPGPIGRTFRTGRVQVGQETPMEQTFAPWGEAESKRNLRSAAAIPLSHDGTIYGVLVVYTSRPLGFSQRELQDLEILGEAIGFAINATKARNLLYAKTVCELEIELTDPEMLLFRASHTLGCTLSLDGCLATGNGDWLFYFAITSDKAERFVDIVKQDDNVRTVSSIGPEENEQVVVITMESALMDSVRAIGGKVTAASIEPDRARFTVEVPQSSDTRSLIEQLRAIYPDMTLVAQTNHERSVTDATCRTSDCMPDLTDRQWQVLEAAYRAGYFEWPRESTAEEVAEQLGITPPTLHAHLRKAENTLLDELFDRESR